MLNFIKNIDKSNVYINYINNKNFGITEIQIINLTKKIKNLHLHCLNNKKDFSNKRSLIIYVSKRKKLLKYLKKININRYIDISDLLKIKKKI